MIDIKNFPTISCNSKEEFNNFNSLFNLANENSPIVIAGPCSVENYKNLDKTAAFLSNLGIKFLRGGIFKPRTSPHSFQGLGKDGLKIINFVGKKYNMVTVSEITDVRNLDIISKYIDIVQIGARNMQNFELLKEVGKSKKPVVLKRYMGATVKEFILAAEYLAFYGNRSILMCERGIRTFEDSTLNTLDISSIALIKKYTKIPIIADLSHSLGRKDIINNVAKCILSLGSDGFMVEVTPNPKLALSDQNSQLNFEESKSLFNYVLNKNFF